MGISTPIKKIAILGSTGSIGQQTLDIVRALPQNFRVIALAGGQNLGLLKRQIHEFRPEFVSCYGRTVFPLEYGEFISLEQMAALLYADIVVVAISGIAGLVPTFMAIRAGKRIALANKESMVMAGKIITETAGKYGAEILPIDSEPGAIWQCLRGEDRGIAKLILTASGGPFLRLSKSQLSRVTPEQALNHPSWKMGRRITIDSATLLNKGFEVIEAHWLFGIPIENIKVVIHPQSIIHSMVEFVDGSVKAQLSYPDMRLPILYALSYPARLANQEIPRLDWDKISQLTFGLPDTDRFPCLKLAIEAGKEGGTYPAALCGADEKAVELFLNGLIKFTDIPRLLEKTLDGHNSITDPAIQDVVAAGDQAKERLKRLAGY